MKTHSRDRVKITHWPDNVTDAYFSSGTVDGTVLRPNGISRTITIKCQSKNSGGVGSHGGWPNAQCWRQAGARCRQGNANTETATVCLPWAAQPSATMALRNGVEGTSVRVTVTYGGAGGPFYLYVWDNYGYALFAKHSLRRARHLRNTSSCGRSPAIKGVAT